MNNTKPQPLVIEGNEFSPRSIEAVEDGYLIGDKFFKSQPELFRYDMSADIKAEEAAAEATVRALMLGSLSEDNRLTMGFANLEGNHNEQGGNY